MISHAITAPPTNKVDSEKIPYVRENVKNLSTVLEVIPYDTDNTKDAQEHQTAKLCFQPNDPTNPKDFGNGSWHNGLCR